MPSVSRPRRDFRPHRCVRPHLSSYAATACPVRSPVAADRRPALPSPRRLARSPPQLAPARLTAAPSLVSRLLNIKRSVYKPARSLACYHPEVVLASAFTTIDRPTVEQRLRNRADAVCKKNFENDLCEVQTIPRLIAAVASHPSTQRNRSARPPALAKLPTGSTTRMAAHGYQSAPPRQKCYVGYGSFQGPCRHFGGRARSSASQNQHEASGRSTVRWDRIASSAAPSFPPYLIDI